MHRNVHFIIIPAQEGVAPIELKATVIPSRCGVVPLALSSDCGVGEVRSRGNEQ